MNILTIVDNCMMNFKNRQLLFVNKCYSFYSHNSMLLSTSYISSNSNHQGSSARIISMKKTRRDRKLISFKILIS